MTRLEKGVEYAEYIIKNEVSIKEAAEHFGVSYPSFSSTLYLVKKEMPIFYTRCQEVIDRVTSTTKTLNASKNRRFGRSY